MNSRFLNILILGFFVTMISACANQQNAIRRNTNIVPTSPGNSIGQGKSVIILPLVDYSDTKTENTVNRNIQISEALMDNLSNNGFTFPIQEDVLKFLTGPSSNSTTGSQGSFDEEMQVGGWSNRMQGIMREEQARSAGGSSSALSKEQVASLGKRFSSDYLLRGRIIEFKSREDQSFDIDKNGLIIPIIGIASRTVLGFIDTDQSTGESPLISLGKSSSAVIELRLWVQDANSGAVVWTNHINVEVAPCCVLSAPQMDNLYSAAIKKSASSLIHDFARSLTYYR